MAAGPGGGVAEEHRAEPADRRVEAPGRKAVNLSVGALEADIAQFLRPGELAGPLDRGRGHVDPERTARLGGARGLPGRLPGPAADVENVIAEPGAAGPAQYFVVPPQLGVVAGDGGALLV
jgi:hypothetical protein